jgi:hypothetical protein
MPITPKTGSLFHAETQLTYEAEQRGGLVVRMNGNEPEIVPISVNNFRQ